MLMSHDSQNKKAGKIKIKMGTKISGIFLFVVLNKILPEITLLNIFKTFCNESMSFIKNC